MSPPATSTAARLRQCSNWLPGYIATTNLPLSLQLITLRLRGAAIVCCDCIKGTWKKLCQSRCQHDRKDKKIVVSGWTDNSARAKDENREGEVHGTGVPLVTRPRRKSFQGVGFRGL